MSGKIQLDLTDEAVKAALAGVQPGGVVTVKVDARLDSSSEQQADLTAVSTPEISMRPPELEGNEPLPPVEGVDFGQEEVDSY